MSPATVGSHTPWMSKLRHERSTRAGLSTTLPSGRVNCVYSPVCVCGLVPWQDTLDLLFFFFSYPAHYSLHSPAGHYAEKKVRGEEMHDQSSLSPYLDCVNIDWNILSTTSLIEILCCVWGVLRKSEGICTRLSIILSDLVRKASCEGGSR